MFRLIFCACLLIALVKTNPVLQNCPGTYSDQNTYRNSFAGLSDIFTPTVTPSPSQITEYEKHAKHDQIHKLFRDRVLNNPSVLDVIKNVQRYNNEDISDYIRNSGNIPNIVNNYIFLPGDVKTENHIKPNKINLESSIKGKIRDHRKKKNATLQIINTPYDSIDKYDDKKLTVDSHQSISKKECVLEDTIETCGNHEDNSKKSLKRSLEGKNKTRDSDNINSELHQNEHLLNSSNSNEVFSNKTINLKNKSANTQKRKHKSKESPDKNTKNGKTVTNPNKDINTTLKKHDSNQNHGSKSKKSGNKSRNNVSDQKKQTKKENKNTNKEIKRKKSGRTDKNVEADNASARNDINDIYKYIDALLSNYQLTNNNFNSGFPFDYNNFYQLSQPWNGINTINEKIVPHKRRKLQSLYGKRLNKKRTKVKKKQKERKVDDEIQHIDTNVNLSKDITKLDRKEESVSLSDKILKDTNMISLGEPDNNLTKVYEQSIINNNSFTQESSHYNSYPSLIIGIEDTVPIIFEDGFIDDYYPNFTADNKALHMTLEDKMHNSEKYHYVSNHNFHHDLEDYIKMRKELGMHNKNTNIKLLSSEKATNGDVKTSEEDVVDNDEIGRMIKFQSPLLLDNPDFRTRKIESNDKYEPYYYHNVFHDPDEDFDKYYSEKKEIVYPTSYSPKNNMKNKLCNEIDDSMSKAKWKRVKDSNVETVYARSKLAKYGLVL